MIPRIEPACMLDRYHSSDRLLRQLDAAVKQLSAAHVLAEVHALCGDHLKPLPVEEDAC